MSQPPGKLHSDWITEEDSWYLLGLCWTLYLKARGRLQDWTMTVVSGSTWAVLTGKCQFCSVTGLLNTCELSRCPHRQNMPTHKVFRKGKALDTCIPEPGELGERGRGGGLLSPWDPRAPASLGWSSRQDWTKSFKAALGSTEGLSLLATVGRKSPLSIFNDVAKSLLRAASPTY